MRITRTTCKVLNLKPLWALAISRGDFTRVGPSAFASEGIQRFRCPLSNRALAAPKYDWKFFERWWSTAETRCARPELGQVFTSQIEAQITSTCP